MAAPKLAVSTASSLYDGIRIPEASMPLHGAMLLSDTLLLCYGQLHHPLNENVLFYVDDVPVHKPLLGTQLLSDNDKYTFVLLHLAQPCRQLRALRLESPAGKSHWKPSRPIALTDPSPVIHWLLSLAPVQRQKALFVLMQALQKFPALGNSALYLHLTRTLMESAEATVETSPLLYHCQPSENLLLLELKADILPTTDNAQALIVSANKALLLPLTILPGHAVVDASNPLIALLSLPEGSNYAALHISVIAGSRIISLPGVVAPAAPGAAALLQRLQSLSPRLRLALREQLAQSLLQHTGDVLPRPAHDLLRALQHYAVPEAASISNPQHPFGFAIEHALPLGQEGMLLSGWIQDAENMLESLTVITDLGHSLPLLPQLLFYPRDAKQTPFANSPHLLPQSFKGFLAYVPYGTESQTLLKQSRLMPRHCRVQVELAGGLRYQAVPAQAPTDNASRQAILLKEIAPALQDNSDASQILAAALAVLERNRAGRTELTAVADLGQIATEPKLSLVVPLRRQDALQSRSLQVLYSALAQDPFLHQCEVLFVSLDPLATVAIQTQLKALHALYDLPLLLLECPKGGTITAACNRAAGMARAEVVLFLQAGIQSENPHWIKTLWEQFSDKPQLAALSPCLLDVTGNISYALPHFQSKPENGLQLVHALRGYARDYGPAREVVSAEALPFSCLMVRAAYFHKAGGFPTDVISEEHAAAALCLGLRKRHGRSVHFGEVQVYCLQNPVTEDVSRRQLSGLAFAAHPTAQLIHARNKQLRSS